MASVVIDEIWFLPRSIPRSYIYFALYLKTVQPLTTQTLPTFCAVQILGVVLTDYAISPRVGFVTNRTFDALVLGATRGYRNVKARDSKFKWGHSLPPSIFAPQFGQ